MQKTRLSITRHCRALTAEFGFNGFTVEQVCELVGISRRTFFNYFPSKLDAVFGQPTDEMPDGAIERFKAARPAGIEGISPTLLADLVALSLEQLTFDEKAIISTHGFFSAVHREPELLQHLAQIGPEKHAEFMDLIATREGVSADHPALLMLAQTLHFASVQSIKIYAEGTGERALSDIFLDFITQAQSVIGQQLQHPAP